jgi:type I restriction-modification system DNA methylase subunit
MEIERTKERVDKTGEIFTPSELVKEILSKLPEESFTNPNKSFIDPACGDGNFLVEVLNLKLSKSHDVIQALSNIYGIDIMEDNVQECKRRLLEIAGNDKQHQNIVDRNIKVGDALKITDFEFFFS